MRFATAIVFGFGLGACGIAPAWAVEPDPALPPAVQQLLRDAEGTGLEADVSTVKVAEGPVAKDGEAVSFGLRHRKTGVIAEAATVRTWMGDIELKAGTPIYSVLFSGISAGRGAGRDALPIKAGWCAPKYAGPLSPEGRRALCFFPIESGRAQFVANSANQTPFAATSLDLKKIHLGTFPKITVQETPLGAELRRVLKLSRIDKKGVSLKAVIDDGERDSDAGFAYAPLTGSTGTFQYWGGEFRVQVAADGKSITIEMLKPPLPGAPPQVQATVVPNGYVIKAPGFTYQASNNLTPKEEAQLFTDAIKGPKRD